MALALYKDGEAEPYDSENPLITVHDSLYGEYKLHRLYLANDSSLHYYENVVLSVRMTVDETELEEGVVSSSGILYQLIQREEEPTLELWERVPLTSRIVLGNIGTVDAADTSFIPFWLRVYAPGSNSLISIEEASIVVTAIERAVL